MQRVVRLFALCSAVILALPPGWCCFALNALAAASVQAADTARPVHQCCRTPHTPRGKESSPPAAPAAPKKSCCCQQDVSGPKDSDAPGQAAPVGVVAGLPQLPVIATISPPTDRFISGPTVSLQLVYCVWTC